MQGSASAREAAPAPAKERGTCAFWLSGRCFGLDIRWVGEVVALDAITRVPSARPAIRGLFNLRGEPVVVLDLVEILDLGSRDQTAGASSQSGSQSTSQSGSQSTSQSGSQSGSQSTGHSSSPSHGSANGASNGLSTAKVGLVLRMGDLVAAVAVERVESVIPSGRGELVPRGDGEHRAVIGLLDDRASGGRIVTVLDSDLLLERLHALRYLTDADD